MTHERYDVSLVVAALATARPTSSGWYRVDCPFCVSSTGKMDRRRSLGIKPMIRFFSCFKCGARGRLPQDHGAMAVLPQPGPGETAPTTFQPPPGFESLGTRDAWGAIMLSEPREYLQRRGVDYDIVIDAQIGACIDGRLVGRVVVPILDLDGETWVGYSARDWTNRQELRYRYPKGMQRAKFLYNQAALYVETDDPVVIVEGVFDALPYWPNAVACLGKPGELHRWLMTEARRPIAVCLDGDAWEEGWALSEWLRTEINVPVGYVRLPPCTDPGSVDRSWLREEARRCVG